MSLKKGFTTGSIRFEKSASFLSTDNKNFLIAPRAHHTSTIVGSFMYIIGGTMGKSFFSDVRVIDLRGRDRDWSIPTLVTSMGTGEFQDVPMRGTITKPFEGRSRHTAVTVKNQKGDNKGEISLYVYGGVHGKDQMFSLSLGPQLEWTRISADGSGPGDLFSHCSASIKSKIYIFGGLDSSSTCSNSLYEFDTVTSRWNTIKFVLGSSSPPPNPYYKMHALGENLILIGNEKMKKKQTKMTLYILNVRSGIERKWKTIDISKKVTLGDMFETVALYDNFDILVREPVGRTVQILIFDGSKPVTSSKKSEEAGSTSSSRNMSDNQQAKMWMLEFSDDIENNEVKVNVVKVPQDSTTPGLRVGQSISALIPPLQIIHNTNPGGLVGHDENEDDSESETDDDEDSSLAISSSMSAASLGMLAHHDDEEEDENGLPYSPRLYMFGGTVHETLTDSSSYTGDLYMGEVPNRMRWQLQTDLSMDKSTGYHRGGPPVSNNNGYDENISTVYSTSRNGSISQNSKTGMHGRPVIDFLPQPRIGGTMTYFTTAESNITGVLVLGGLRSTYKDMKDFERKNINCSKALSGTNGGAPCQVMLRTKQSTTFKNNSSSRSSGISTHNTNHQSKGWHWSTCTLTEGNHNRSKKLPEEAQALLFGGIKGLVHGCSVSVISSSSSSSHGSNIVRFAIFGGYTESYSKSTNFSPLSLLDINIDRLLDVMEDDDLDERSSISNLRRSKGTPMENGIKASSSLTDGVFFNWCSIPLENPMSRIGHSMVTDHHNKLWIIGGYGKNKLNSKSSRYLNNTLFIELHLNQKDDIGTPTFFKSNILSNSHDGIKPPGYGTLARAGHSTVKIANRSKYSRNNKIGNNGDDDDDIHCVIYGGIKLKKKLNNAEICSDEILLVKYKSNGKSFTVQSINTSGKSPGGLYGHSAELIYDVNQNVPGISLNRDDISQKNSATRMVVVGK